MQALLGAAERGDVATLASILDAHPDIINERGTLEGHTGLRTALHFGVEHVEVVRALLERGADPNIRDEGDNAFPLHFAAERGDIEVITLLVEHGAQTVAGEEDDHQLDIIGWATCFPNVEIRPAVVEYLLAHGARHTLHSAVAVGDVESIRARARGGSGRHRAADGQGQSAPSRAAPCSRQEPAPIGRSAAAIWARIRTPWMRAA